MCPETRIAKQSWDEHERQTIERQRRVPSEVHGQGLVVVIWGLLTSRFFDCSKHVPCPDFATYQVGGNLDERIPNKFCSRANSPVRGKDLNQFTHRNGVD